MVRVYTHRWELHLKQKTALSQLGLKCSTLNPTEAAVLKANPGDTSIVKTINIAELAGIVAALIKEHAQIATDSAGSIWQIKDATSTPSA
jgi:hypothetical protein